MADNPRIEQFRKMATDDPANVLAHFSLGRELQQAGQDSAAADSFRRVLELDRTYSRAYALLGSVLVRLGKKDDAISTLVEGIKVAHARGDLMPKSEMSQMLAALGGTLPELAGGDAGPVAVGDGQVRCKRCGEIKPRLPKAPMRNAFGQEIFENTCADCWKLAIGHGTKVINELRLPMTDPAASKVWDQHIREFLNL